MSAPIAESSRGARGSPDADPALSGDVPSDGRASRNIGALAIVGIALGLMILSGLAAFLILSRGGPIDGAATLESAFGVRTIGADYAIVQARQMPGGARLVVLEDRAAAPEPPRADAAAKSAPTPPPTAEDPSSARKADDPSPAMKSNEPVDWTRVSIPSSRTRPRRVTFLFQDAGATHDSIATFFQDVDRRSLSDLGAQGGKVTIASGKLGWRGFDADWVHERAFEKGGTFRDEMRVDLSLVKRPCVLTAVWTRGEPASRAALDELLAALGTK